MFASKKNNNFKAVIVLIQSFLIIGFISPLMVFAQVDEFGNPITGEDPNIIIDEEVFERRVLPRQPDIIEAENSQASPVLPGSQTDSGGNPLIDEDALPNQAVEPEPANIKSQPTAPAKSEIYSSDEDFPIDEFGNPITPDLSTGQTEATGAGSAMGNKFNILRNILFSFLASTTGLSGLFLIVVQGGFRL